MSSLILASRPSPSRAISQSENTAPPPRIQFKLQRRNRVKCIEQRRTSHSRFSCSFSLSQSFSSKLDTRRDNFSALCLAVAEMPADTSAIASVARRLGRLISEFRSLTEPIDRVKRLLDYAARLSPIDESARVPENKVTGCTAQVWLDVSMDDCGKVRFRAGSDSEITKGFISCLIYILDGAEPLEVEEVEVDDLADMNVGLASTARSRVNTWHNVLFSMQERSKALIAENDANSLLEPFMR